MYKKLGNGPHEEDGNCHKQEFRTVKMVGNGQQRRLEGNVKWATTKR
jgi:hypothetical protein